MKEKDTPLKLVRLWPKMQPDCYDKLNVCRAAKENGDMSWPDYCVLPISAAYTYLMTLDDMTPDAAAAGAAELTACWTWRRHKVAYAFDPDLAAALAEQAEDLTDTDVLPVELLLHLPYPIIYIKAPGLLEHMDGFWAWNEFDVNREAPELRIQWVFDDMEHSLPQVMHLIPGGTIGDCVRDTLHTTKEVNGWDIAPDGEGEDGAGIARIILQAVQLLLYLLAENADTEEQPMPVRPQSSAPRKKTAKIIQDKAGEVKGYNVGIRVGAAFRKARRHAQANPETAGTGGTKRPHTRRGHWHHYWVGPLQGKRSLILKWTAPTVIHPDAAQGDNLVVFPVKK